MYCGHSLLYYTVLIYRKDTWNDPIDIYGQLNLFFSDGSLFYKVFH